jgi:hypothetical protein
MKGREMNHIEVKEVGERVEEALREIGVLLIAFAPLDVALTSHTAANANYLLLFLGLGIYFFVGALILERIRGKDAPGTWLLIFLIFGVFLIVAAFMRGLGV